MPAPNSPDSETAPDSSRRPVTFFHALLPILVLLGLIVLGLIVPQTLDGMEPIPLELVFISAASFTVAMLFYLGFTWSEIEAAIDRKLKRALPAFFILFSIGLLIGSWMVCGTIPMLVYYGLKLIDPTWIYLLAFLVPAVFSILTGTSWGSAGAVGIVIIGIAEAMGADLGITAGAIIGGAVFGDKMSPLSDTTNLAALAADVDLYDHIRSMLYTTVPSAAVAMSVYLVVGLLFPPEANADNVALTQDFLSSLEGIFQFNVLLLLPPLVVLYSSIRQKPTLPTLIVASGLGVIFAIIFQRFTFSAIANSLITGFSTDMASQWHESVPQTVGDLLNRGGLYALKDAVVIAFTVFIFIGAMDCINGIPRVVGEVFRFARTRPQAILSALAATAVTNSLTSNQYATSFIVGDAFKSKFDRLGIPRKVLSRSLEDTGTMLETMVPWTPTAVFMIQTLGVSYSEYWNWQLLSLCNFVVAPTLAITGIGCFYNESANPNAESSSDDSAGVEEIPG